MTDERDAQRVFLESEAGRFEATQRINRGLTRELLASTPLATELCDLCARYAWHFFLRRARTGLDMDMRSVDRRFWPLLFAHLPEEDLTPDDKPEPLVRSELALGDETLNESPQLYWPQRPYRFRAWLKTERVLTDVLEVDFARRQLAVEALSKVRPRRLRADISDCVVCPLTEVRCQASDAHGACRELGHGDVVSNFPGAEPLTRSMVCWFRGWWWAVCPEGSFKHLVAASHLIWHGNVFEELAGPATSGAVPDVYAEALSRDEPELRRLLGCRIDAAVGLGPRPPVFHSPSSVLLRVDLERRLATLRICIDGDEGEPQAESTWPFVTRQTDLVPPSVSERSARQSRWVALLEPATGFAPPAPCHASERFLLHYSRKLWWEVTKYVGGYAFYHGNGGMKPMYRYFAWPS